MKTGARSTPLWLHGAHGFLLGDSGSSGVAEALAAHASPGAGNGWAEIKSDRRARVTAGPSSLGPLVVKEYRTRGVGRLLADLFRGSPARRAWRGGHGLEALGIGAATPVAFLEWRRFGLARASTAVFEDVRPAAPADSCPVEIARPDEVVDVLTDLVLALHRRGVVHGDLKASHVYLHRKDGRPAARLIDLDGVRFRRRLRDRDRIRALAELNGSLPDAVPDALRCRAFWRYAHELPFRCGAEAALRAIVAASLARQHRWVGRECKIAGAQGARVRAPAVRLSD